MARFDTTFQAVHFAGSTLGLAGPAAAETGWAVDQAVTDAVELPSFSFAVYDVDFTVHNLTTKLVAQFENLQITLCDDTTFDRYYSALDREATAAALSDLTDENLMAAIEVLAPVTTANSMGTFVDGPRTEFTFAKGGILAIVGEGTDLTKVIENGGSMVVDF